MCNCERPQEVTCPIVTGNPRIFTHFLPPCEIGNMPALQRRTEMITNADKYINMERTDAFVKNRCEPCFAYEENGTELPIHSKMTCNESFCTITMDDAQGLGQGRNNDTSRFSGFDPIYYPIDGKPVGKFAAVDGFRTL